MSIQSHGTEYTVEAVKASPPLAVTGSMFAGVDLQSWVLVATLVYTVLQIALTVRKFFKERKADGSR